MSASSIRSGFNGANFRDGYNGYGLEDSDSDTEPNSVSPESESTLVERTTFEETPEFEDPLQKQLAELRNMNGFLLRNYFSAIEELHRKDHENLVILENYSQVIDQLEKKNLELVRVRTQLNIAQAENGQLKNFGKIVSIQFTC